METIIENPGIQHLAENVFWNLNFEDLKICAQINQSCKQILENPMFWLKKFRIISKENYKDWIKAIKLEKNSDKKKAIVSYLQWNLKKEVIDLPCYTNPDLQDYFLKKIISCCMKKNSSDEVTETVKVLAHVTNNPNAPDKNGVTPIYWAALNGKQKLSLYWPL